MTPQQREAAMRLADELQRFDGAERESLRDEAAALLRELAAAQGEHQQHWCTYCRGVNAHNCQFNPNVPRMQTYVTTSTSTSTAPLFDHPPQQRRPPREQITAAAKALCRQASTACNVDFDDNWKVYGDNYIADATAALNAAYGIGEAP